MKPFECRQCGQLLYFGNTRCESCGHVLGFQPETARLETLNPGPDGVWHPIGHPGGTYRFCRNAGYDACNWLVPATGDEVFCRACRLNRTIPDLSIASNLALWQRIEAAKHRLVYGLLRLGLPVVSKLEDPERGVAFDFLADTAPTFAEGPQIMTGHEEGTITINLAEADDAERERMRQEMAEPYRTLLGHFRHEIGHHYWERLARHGGWLDSCRATFGDERRDYAEALATHYAQPIANWQENHVSSYASAHPWEDFAETWAHYMHIVDTLETANGFGLGIAPRAGKDPTLTTRIDFDACQERSFDVLLAAWLPLTYAVNSLNESMGQPDLYPFVLSPTVIDKLRLVHDMIRQAGGTRSGG
ncbi:zinc-binding metallopeptidase family protein [Oceanibacterium hippocampi]|uniref:Zinc-ribbon domain-containing protein n=1 Tax=Oceanibacterium hippocampi TaxID=745714 RepID=A0A1Y5TYF8_9PROT|nr:putative zinc-binding peptidase [Oceanibacterium hippocampi]SLN75788.1 hypothetical protein OCH7691_03961 [Oceanibacterium hippocampi]